MSKPGQRPQIERSSGRYSASDQAEMPDQAEAERGKSIAGQPREPWHGHPKPGEGDHGYRRDQGAGGKPVDGDTKG